MKTSLSVITVVAIIGLSVSVEAESQINSWIPSGSLSLSLQERYIGIRSSRVLYDGPSFWSELVVNLPKGLYLNIWDHQGIAGDPASKQPNELDLTFGWRGKVPLWGLEAGFSTTYLNNSPVGLWFEGDVWSQAATLSKTYRLGNHTLKPQLRVEWFSRANDVGGGVYLLMPNVSHTWEQPFGIKPLCLAEQAFIIHDDGFKPAKNDSESYFLRWNAGLRWRLSKSVALTLPSFSAQIPLHSGNDGRGQATSWGTSLVFSF